MICILIHISYQTLYLHKTNVHKATLNHYEINIITFLLNIPLITVFLGLGQQFKTLSPPPWANSLTVPKWHMEWMYIKTCLDLKSFIKYHWKAKTSLARGRSIKTNSKQLYHFLELFQMYMQPCIRHSKMSFSFHYLAMIERKSMT
jgi:hypothetical protein